MASSTKRQSLSDVLDQLREEAKEQDGEISVQAALDAFSGRLFGPLLLVPGLVIVTPLGTIPTVPTLMGVVVILIATQALFGRTHPWLPKVIAARSVDQERFTKALDRFAPWAKWIDRFMAPRLQQMITGRMKYVVAAICVLVALTLPPLELLPGAAIVPGVAITLMGLAITTEDGLLGLLGMMASAGTLGLVVWAAV